MLKRKKTNQGELVVVLTSNNNSCCKRGIGDMSRMGSGKSSVRIQGLTSTTIILLVFSLF